ncbi:MAG: sulfatase [Actinomycetota bacterium]|nr:sulfatase [Actinomycetota bacterium]
MVRAVGLLASVALSVVVVLSVVLFSGASNIRIREAQAATTKPNFVFILVDDMRKDDLKYMPKTRNLLKDRGKYFANAFVSNPICCPSRATIMRGQYAHNTHVWTNINSSIGGWEAYRTRGYQKNNVATHLDAAGYRTALIGKYLNQYYGTAKPPGWDKWFATVDPTTYNYFNYDINNNGTTRHYGSTNRDYKTDVLSRQTRNFIGASVARGRPFFTYVAPIAPHYPSTPAPRDLHTYDGLRGPRLPSFNEEHLSDKPSWIRQLPRLTTDRIRNMDDLSEQRAESLQAVDDLVAGVVKKLKNAGVMRNTYIFFTSDNGFFRGEHRIPWEKYRPYEEDIRVPLLVRGPGIKAGSTTGKLALNTDYLPTFTELAGAQTPSYVDGRSLTGVLEGSVTNWRHAILIEGPQYKTVPPYRGIRTQDANTEQKYIEYNGTSEREMYYLGVDPYELANKNVPSAGLAARLDALRVCKGDTCRTAEDAH